MPDWAKAIGSCLPLTYFSDWLRALLKGYSARHYRLTLPLIGLA
jgi:ABC-2 type transport system permease protein